MGNQVHSLDDHNGRGYERRSIFINTPQSIFIDTATSHNNNSPHKEPFNTPKHKSSFDFKRHLTDKELMSSFGIVDQDDIKRS